MKILRQKYAAGNRVCRGNICGNFRLPWEFSRVAKTKQIKILPHKKLAILFVADTLVWQTCFPDPGTIKLPNK